MSIPRLCTCGHACAEHTFDHGPCERLACNCVAYEERGIRATSTQQLGFLSRDVLPALCAITDGFTYDPGHSDLDDEQIIDVRMTLGDYRRARRIKHELEKMP